MTKVVCSFILFLGLLSVLSCFIAEFVKTKIRDVKCEDQLQICHIPKSAAFALGIVAVICLIPANIIGNFAVYRRLPSGNKTEICYKDADSLMSGAFLFLSWVNFDTALILLTTATNGSREQLDAEVAVNGSYHLVKDGVFLAAGCHVILTIGSVLLVLNKTRTEQTEITNNLLV